VCYNGFIADAMRKFLRRFLQEAAKSFLGMVGDIIPHSV
jgi:hypothetical protein